MSTTTNNANNFKPAPQPIASAAEAENLVRHLLAAMDALVATVEQETTLVRAGNVKQAAALEATKAELARAYAAHFTEQELKDMLVFYKTPLGQKFVKEEPAAIEDGLKRAQQWADTFADTVMGRMRSEMQKKGHPL